jgi:hypothetical protein
MREDIYEIQYKKIIAAIIRKFITKRRGNLFLFDFIFLCRVEVLIRSKVYNSRIKFQECYSSKYSTVLLLAE